MRIVNAHRKAERSTVFEVQLLQVECEGGVDVGGSLLISQRDVDDLHFLQ